MDDLAKLVDKRNALREEVEGLSDILELKKKQQSQIFGTRASVSAPQEAAAPAVKRKRILEFLPPVADSSSGAKLPRRSVFGQLVGHLNKALEEENAQAERSRQQKQRLAAAEEKEKRQKWIFLDEEMRELELSVSEKCWAIEQIEKDIKTKNKRFAISQVIKQWSVMENFIRTAAEPCLFWTPYRHNSQTRRLQDDTRHEIQQKLKNLQSQPEVGQK